MAVLCACTQLADLKPTDQTAVLKAGDWGKVYRGGYVGVESVNGVAPQWRLRSAVQVPAGERLALLGVYLCTTGPKHCIPVAQAQVSFHAEAGHTYWARAQEQAHGRNRFWVWLEDEGSGRLVGGNAPRTPDS
jgi:hypothetical protein